MKNVVLIFLLLFYSNAFFGQTLVRYGNQTISRNEFLQAFRKNNPKVKASDATYRDYLNLYIRYRLKVQAAMDMKLDTMLNQQSDLKNFRNQIIDQYTNDESSLNDMAKEAFARSQRDICVSYIFVAVAKNASPADTARAWKKIQEAYRALKSNKDFGETAAQFSEDPFAKSNLGNIGYVTVFDLPYTIESVAYKIAKGKISPAFRADGGYVILEKTDERPAKGRIQIAQILLIYPYKASDVAKIETHQRADSIYKQILAGADFSDLARKFSGDNLSYQLGGLLPEFGIGKYEAGFENTAFALKKDGEVSAPYESSFGYHIMKRISRKSVPIIADQKNLDEIKQRIKSDSRILVSRKQMLRTIVKQTQGKEFIPSGNVLWSYTDSILQNKKPVANAGINNETVLFQFSDKKYAVGDWVAYRKGLKSTPILTNGKTNPELFDVYRQMVEFDYYKEHLEKYNPAFAAQINEFRDGNLLFEIMQRQVWTKASADSAGLKKYFEEHVKNYWWKPGAEAIIFSAPSQSSAEKLRVTLEKDITGWKKQVDSFGMQLQADSGRFELKQIPGESAVGAGQFTGFVTNPDKSVQIAYIIRRYATSSPRTFEDARGLAINDYQNELENNWIVELRKKYPVITDESVFKTLPK